MPRRITALFARHFPIASLTVGTLILIIGCSPSNELTPDQLVQAKAAYESCLICHSNQEMQRGPIIDGLPAWYVQHQLEKYRDGIRGQKPENRSEHLMGSARDRIGDAATIDLLARYIESLPAQERYPVVRGDREQGEILYGRCVACHGAKGEGNLLLKSPPLNIQEDWYLLDQLRKYAKGARGYHPQDLSGQQMVAAMTGLDDTSLKNIVAYLQTFEPPAN